MKAAVRTVLVGAWLIAALLVGVFIAWRASRGQAVTPAQVTATDARAIDEVADVEPEFELEFVDQPDTVDDVQRSLVPELDSAENSGVRIKARVMRDDRPVADASARLRRMVLGKDGVSLVPDRSTAQDLVIRRRTDDSGRVTFRPIRPGTYELTLSARGSDEFTVAPIVVDSGVDVDLGDLFFARRASIVGAVLLPPLLTTCVLKIRAKAVGHDRCAITDALGRFSFDDLTAGNYTLAIAPSDWCAVQTESLTVELAPGDRRDVCFDLRERVGAVLTLDIFLNHQRATKSRSTVVADSDGQLTVAVFIDDDESARRQPWKPVVIVLPRSQTARLELRCSSMLLHTESLDALSSKEPSRRLIDLEVGRLLVEVPAGLDRSGPGRLTFVIRTSDGTLEMLRDTSEVDLGVESELPAELELGPLPVGSVDISLRCESTSVPPTHEPFEWSASATIRRSETTRAVLRRR